MQTMTMAAPGLPRSLRWPIRWRLSLVICTLLLACVTAFGWAAHREVEQALLDLTRARMQNVSRQLVGLLAQGAQQRVDEAKKLVAQPGVKALIDAPGDAATLEQVKEGFQTFLKTSPQTSGLELWDAAGVRLIDLTQAPPPPPPSSPTPAQPQSPTPAQTSANGTPPSRTTAPTAIGFSPLLRFHDGAYYEVTVAAAGSTPTAKGYLVLRRHATTPGTAAAVSTLIGNSMTVQIGSKDGVWTDLSKVVPAPPTADTSATAEYRTPDGEERLGIAASMRETPWLLWIAMPRSVALAPADLFLRRIIPLSALVVGLGWVIAWIVARRMTRPLGELTVAAESLAAGDLTHRVQVTQHDEIGRLGDAFNTMAGRVEESYQRLDARVRERTQDLEQTMSTLKNTQEELVRREKLAMLGQLASGVGHELRNPLGVMTNAVYFLEMVQPDATSVVKEYHALLRAQIGLSEKIVSDLLDFARIKPPRREVLPLSRLVKDQLARVSVQENIRVVSELPELPPVFVDAVQMGQVVFNLLVNAVQAMEERGGVLTVRGSFQHGLVHLDVIDNGPGVAPDLREKIFEALFTTKARGIGLGLAVSRSLAEANEGTLSLTSRPGEGATFTLAMPVAAVLEPA